MPRCIAHLDMDAFYASVELRRHPQLRGRPVVVGGSRRADAAPGRDESAFARLRDYAGRGVVTTATYEARAFGVRSGMGLMKAARLVPDAVLLPADFAQYAHYSRLFKAAVRKIVPCIEDRGIDEIYLDLSEIDDDPVEVAGRLKGAVREATGLSCSIGIAANKLLAKIASDLDKPDGLTLLAQPDLAARVWPLRVATLNGVGPKAAARLGALGIASVGQLAAAAPELLIGCFGRSYGAWLHEAAHGRDSRPLVTQREPRSVSRETTFERDLHPRADRDALSAILLALCRGVAEDLERKGLRGRTIGIKLRHADFRTVTRDLTLEHYTADADAIRAAARACLKRVALDRRLRLLGVRVGSLAAAQTTLREARTHAPSAGRIERSLPLFD
jgi:DNA polymerase-4